MGGEVGGREGGQGGMEYGMDSDEEAKLLRRKERRKEGERGSVLGWHTFLRARPPQHRRHPSPFRDCDWRSAEQLLVAHTNWAKVDDACLFGHSVLWLHPRQSSECQH